MFLGRKLLRVHCVMTLALCVFAREPVIAVMENGVNSGNRCPAPTFCVDC
ncbi:hypothetical protein GCM10019059_40780 [Camelimonas fluminis]|nr:hypothetical protein GCM10019059_40780 [Camelimonas fluminis]